jgi:hypothetical protein
MRRRTIVIAGALGLVTASVTVAVTAAPKPTAFADARLIVEVNATDGDAGLQIFLDGEPWKQVEVRRPGGGRIIDFETAGVLRGYGLTELFSESSEPRFTEFPLSEFKALFPEGMYTFSGTTIDGTPLTGRASLSHDLPNGPLIVAPEDGERLSDGRVAVRWRRGTQPSGVEVVGYQVVVTREDPQRVLAVELPASVTSLTLPAEFVQQTEYALEVLAIEASGNQTLTEIHFTVR